MFGQPSPNIPAALTNDGRFATLLAAVNAAGLAETLSGEGPFTLAAPTDEAFAQLPEGTVESLLLPENRDQLAGLLLYHVIAGVAGAETVVERAFLPTVSGSKVRITTAGNGVKANLASIIETDLPADNGLIHVIDNVLLPSQVSQMALSRGPDNRLLITWEGGNGPYTLEQKALTPNAIWTAIETTDDLSFSIEATHPGALFRVVESDEE